MDFLIISEERQQDSVISKLDEITIFLFAATVVRIDDVKNWRKDTTLGRSDTCDNNVRIAFAIPYVMLELSRLGINVAALSETWLTGSGSVCEANYTSFWCGHPDTVRPKHGVGFAVHNRLLSCIQQPISISPRLMTLRMCLKYGYITIISAYAPTLMDSTVSKEEFNEIISETILNIPAGDNLALIGDFNARIGSDFNSWRNVIGPHGIGRMNENGQRLRELCADHSLCVASTYFKGRICSKTTWMHPRSHRCQDPHLQSISLLQKNDANVAKLQELLAGHFATTRPSNPEAAWSRLRSAVTECALSVFGRSTRKQPAWFTANAVLLLPTLQAKRIARDKARIQNTRSAKAVYRAAKNTLQRLTRNALHFYWKDLSDRIQMCSDTGDLHGLYNGIKEAIGPVPKKSAPLLSRAGEVLTESVDQLKRWMEHFSSIYATDLEINSAALSTIQQVATIHDLDRTITKGEVQQAIHGKKNN
ncbi:uncharacterized protein LOC117107580 [Anneissia japonica]|uniref:uncharacterized protein LOC117107580 n=1 Tax=Anneissia japonica TaxID=1529436 RepID=UPI001425B734|nr:uncharacterized protein LOC117107580 [Anneissia japonica]